MKIKILEHTTNPIETVYRAFKICYAKGVPTNIKIPMRDGKVDYKKMIAFIEKWGGIGHESPYEHVSITFAIEGVSRALSHQLVRHRLASYNQQSQRYVNLEGCLDYVVPPEVERNKRAATIYRQVMGRSHDAYVELTEILKAAGRNEKEAIEDVRYVFPNACCTNLICIMNLRQLRHFLRERMCLKSQWEIREMAAMMFQEAREVVPFMGLNLMKCANCFEVCHKAQGVKFEELKAARDVFAAEVEDLLTRIDLLTEERDVAEDKLEGAEMEVEGLKEEISSLQEYIEDSVWRENWGGRI